MVLILSPEFLKYPSDQLCVCNLILETQISTSSRALIFLSSLILAIPQVNHNQSPKEKLRHTQLNALASSFLSNLHYPNTWANLNGKEISPVSLISNLPSIKKACRTRIECILYTVRENWRESLKLNLLKQAIKEFGKLIFKATARSERLTCGVIFILHIKRWISTKSFFLYSTPSVPKIVPGNVYPWGTRAKVLYAKR